MINVEERDGHHVSTKREDALLGVWLALYGLAGIVPLGLPSPLIAVVVLIAGILSLAGR